MHLTKRKASSLARGVAAYQGMAESCKCIVFPTYVHLDHVRRHLRGSNVLLGAQNWWSKKEGAFTGEISPYMLRDMGVSVVLLGHSERRHILGETDPMLEAKLKVALKAKLEVILCIGETYQERQEGRTYDVLQRQIQALKVVQPQYAQKITLAYEPVWAIGTGETATPGLAQDAHRESRRLAAGFLGDEAAAKMPILYGGSMKPLNAAELLHQPDVDGGLIGGASLNMDQFGPILDAANAADPV